LNKLSKDELLDVLREYDRYIQSANEDNRYREGWFPVCINEFYDNEYQMVLEERGQYGSEVSDSYACGGAMSADDLEKSGHVKRLLEAIANTALSYENGAHNICFDYDGVIGLLDRAQMLITESARCPRPENLPPGMPWSERLYDGEDFDPYVYDGSMSAEDYERMRELMADGRESGGMER
jgi:hypothetical protein